MADTASNGPQGAGAVVSDRAGTPGLICREAVGSAPRRCQAFQKLVAFRFGIGDRGGGLGVERGDH